MLELLRSRPKELPLDLLARLKSKFFLVSPNAAGMQALLESRLATRNETITGGVSLHVIVPTLQCGHTCKYCQVSRSLEDRGFSMSLEQVEKSCDYVFQSSSQTITVEFQGGDPLLRYDLVRHAIERVSKQNEIDRRNVRFVIASTLHQLTEEMLVDLSGYPVVFSTSIDGPAELHNKNRPIPSRDAYERTVDGIELIRKHMGKGAVAALMTTSKESLLAPVEIVDEYVRLGFSEIFLRPLSPYGFAKRNERALGFAAQEFQAFYMLAFERILYWNRQGVPLREVTASIALNKILSPFDSGYVDLQSPTGAGSAAMVYNYDGYVYPSDEARMLAESGNKSLRLGKIGEQLHILQSSKVAKDLIHYSTIKNVPECSACTFNSYCGPDPVGMFGQFGRMAGPIHLSEHCNRYFWLFDFLFNRLVEADSWFEDLAYSWARPALREAIPNADRKS
jgi:His-Xaa-Ser system radical SAM maturase HxsB